MKTNFKISCRFSILARTFFAAAALLAFSTAHIFPSVVNASYATGAEVPVRSNGFTATGKSINLALNFAPAPGTQLVVVRNTGSDLIKGAFSNLAQGQIVALTYGGVTYKFVANYNGGKGNDLVLLWTSGDESIPATALPKLDDQIVLALKQSRSQPPFDKPTSLEPDIPIKDAGRMLVDIEGSVSQELLDQIAIVGGQVVNESVTATKVRAMVPLLPLEALATRADVKFISPARISIISEVKTPSAP
ncbi:MAG: trimeric autotransporter adhesin [Verrucomicrobiota bacterium]|jgi:hypothetical protein